MTPRLLLRAPTALGWLALAGAAAALAVLIGQGLGLRWDPFDLQGRRLRAAEARAEAAWADADARRLESEAAAARSERLDQLNRQSHAVARVVERAATQARSADDADLPLDPARADRLADADRRLCELAADLCLAAASDASGDGGQPCRLDRLPNRPTQADLETAYLARGEALVLCDQARATAVETLIAERELLARWLAPVSPR